MLDNFRKSIVDRLLGTSYEVGEDELLDSETVQIQSDIHDGPLLHINSHRSRAIDAIQVVCYWIRSRRTGNSVGEVEGEQRSQHSHFCARPHELCQPSMATRSEVMEVLYPRSHLKIPQALDPEAPPPAYDSRPIFHSYTPEVRPPCNFPRERREFKLLVPATPRTMPYTPQGLLTPSMEPVLLSDTSTSFLDFVVPSTKSPRSRPRLPISGIGLKSPECDRDELPAYSRFDSLRPRLPTGSDILGPYPYNLNFCRNF